MYMSLTLERADGKREASLYELHEAMSGGDSRNPFCMSLKCSIFRSGESSVLTSGSGLG